MSTEPSPALLARLDGEWRRREYHADCPFCGKEARRGQNHFSLFHRRSWGYKCHVCGSGGSLTKLAIHLGLPQQMTNATEHPARIHQTTQERRDAPNWATQPNHTLERLCGHLARLERWQAYKPLTMESISRWRLGLGGLPASRCKLPRLIVPVFDGDELVALHGRACRTEDRDAKWLTSAGSRKDILFNAELLVPGKTVVITENMVDAILAMQARPDLVAVASGGVGWTGSNLERWSAQIAASRPRQIIVWLDNDLAGQASGAIYQQLLVDWHADMRQRLAAGTIPRIPAPPEPAGPRIANALLALNQRVHVYQWPPSAPPKADLAWALQAA